MSLPIARSAQVAELRRILTNLTLRLRARLVVTSAQPDRFAFAIADTAGPLRVAAATLISLETGKLLSPREALSAVATARWNEAASEWLEHISQARQTGMLAANIGQATLTRMLELTSELRTRAAKLH